MDTIRCPNCLALVEGKHCPNCGQKRIERHDYRVGHFFEQAFHDVTHFDSKIFRSLVPLIARPGFLTAEYLAGRRGRYIKPVTLFVLVNLAFFLFGIRAGFFRWGFESSARTWPVSAFSERWIESKMRSNGLTRQALAEKFDAKSVDTKRYIFFASIPMLAAAMTLLLWPLKRYFVEHLIFSIHFHAFYLTFLLTIFPILRGWLRGSIK